MQVSFDATLDEFVDVNLRTLKRTGMWEQQRKRVSVWVGIAGPIIALAILSFGQLSLEQRLSIAGVIGFVAFGLYGFRFPQLEHDRVRTFCQKRIGADKTFPVTVELEGQGVSFTQLGSKSIHGWATVQGIQRCGDDIDIQFVDGSVGTVRTRAFESSQQQLEFAEIANHYLRAR